MGQKADRAEGLGLVFRTDKVTILPLVGDVLTE